MKRSPFWFALIGLLFLVACAPAGSAPEEAGEAAAADETAVASFEVPAAERFPADKYDEYQIVTLLPRDAIPAIDNPQFQPVSEADKSYDPDELIIGVSFNGDTRAYSVPFLSGHEIVNDTVGGVKIAVTW